MSDCNHGDVALRSPCSQCGAPICCGVCCDLDEKDRRIAALQAENAKLRKVAEAASAMAQGGVCSGYTSFYDALREAGYSV
jgi:hypothetical protein